MQEGDRVFLQSQARELFCPLCKKQILSGMVVLGPGNAVICVYCGGIDSMVFIPSGDPALTRRASKYSSQAHVVWKFSKARKRNERQGVIVDQAALDKAMLECESDEAKREKQQAKSQKVREKQDQEYQEAFAQKIRELYPNCPAGRENIIATHATEKYSGRVGRAAAAKEFAPDAIKLAVRAHIRHAFTEYDDLMARYSKEEARQTVRKEIDKIEASWEVNSISG